MTSPSAVGGCCPDIGVVGAGRAGSVLGAALAAAGARVVAVSAVSASSRARAATLLPGVCVRPPDEVAAAADLLVLAVPDDVLAMLVTGLAELGALHPGQVVAHLSGRYGLAVLDPATRAGARPLALHPVMTVTGTPDDIGRLAGAAFGVTAPPDLRDRAFALVRAVGGRPVEVREELRALWHAGLAHGANHLVTLVSSAADVLRAAGIADPAQVLRPLLSAALDNALREGDGALTGPVARGDAGTVATHLEALAAYAPAQRRAYVALARATAGRLPAPPPAALLDVLSAAGVAR